MFGNWTRNLLVVFGLTLMAACVEPAPVEKPVVAAPVVKKPVATAPVAKKPVGIIDFGNSGPDGGGGGGSSGGGGGWSG